MYDNGVDRTDLDHYWCTRPSVETIVEFRLQQRKNNDLSTTPNKRKGKGFVSGSSRTFGRRNPHTHLLSLAERTGNREVRDHFRLDPSSSLPEKTGDIFTVVSCTPGLFAGTPSIPLSHFGVGFVQCRRS